MTHKTQLQYYIFFYEIYIISVRYHTEIAKNICFQFCNIQGCNLGSKIAVQDPTHYNQYAFFNQLAEGTKQTTK